MGSVFPFRAWRIFAWGALGTGCSFQLLLLIAVQPRLTQYFTANDIDKAAIYFRDSRVILRYWLFLLLSLLLAPEAVLTAWLANETMIGIAVPIVPFLLAANGALAIALLSMR